MSAATANATAAAPAISAAELARINAEMGHDAQALTRWALGLGQRAIVTTNFRPFEAVILHLVTQVQPDVPVVWMDNGYNTEATYRYADEVTKQLGLNLKIYLPLRSRAHREAVEGATPALDDPHQVGGIVVVELSGEPEPIAQRPGQQACARRRTDQGEARDLQRDLGGAGPLADDDVDAKVLHRQIQHLFGGSAHAVNLVEKEDLSLGEPRQDGGQVTGVLDGRARTDP